MLSLSLLIVASLSHLLSALPKASWGLSHGILPLGAGGTHASDLQPHRHNVKAGVQQHCERALVLASERWGRLGGSQVAAKCFADQLRSGDSIGLGPLKQLTP